MSFASSNRTALRVVKETQFGVIPTNPSLKSIRYTSESLNHNLTYVTSSEIRADRNTADLIQTKSDATGDINFELSHGSFDDFIEGAFASSFSTPLSLSGNDIAANSAAGTFTSSSTSFSSIVPGQWVKISGFANTDLNKYYKAVTVAANTLAVLPGSIPADEAAGNIINIDGSMIRNGVELHSYTVQKHIQDATIPAFINFIGTRIGSMNLSFSTGQILTGSFSTMSLDAQSGTTQIPGASLVAAPATTPMNAVGNLTSVFLDDALSTAFFSSLTLNLNNNLRAQDAIGNLKHVGIALSRLEVGGDISIYFEDLNMYNKYLQAQKFSISLVLEDDSGKAYIFTIPAVKFESGKLVSGGLDQDVMFDASWKAYFDPTTSCTIQLDTF